MARGKKTEKVLTPEEKLEQALVPVEEQPYPVPENWCWTRVGAIASVKGGKRVPKGKQLVEYKTEHPYIRVTDFDNQSIIVEQIKYVDNETFNMIRNYTISKKDIYISIAGTIGKVGIVPDILDGANLTENAAKITNIRGIEQRYLLWLLQSELTQIQIKDYTISTTQPKLALFRIENINVPFPPYDEQQRIVHCIESLFVKLDKAKEKAQAVVDGFETRRAAILHKAFTGELTEKWRKENNIALDSWCWKTINEVCFDIKVGIVIKPSQYYTDNIHGTPAFRSANVRENHVDNFDWVYLNDKGMKANHRSIVHTGDVLIVRSGNPGTACVVTEEFDGYNAIDILIAVPNPEIVLPEYLCLFTNSPLGKKTIAEGKRGMALAHFNVKSYSKVDICLPMLNEQKEIIDLFRRLLLNEQEVKKTTEAVLDQIETMKKSILARAFRGELGTNDLSEECTAKLLENML